MRNQNFEKFYYNKVALGEGCGCAERVIDVHEFDRLSGKPRMRSIGGRPTLFGRLIAVFRRPKADSVTTED